MSEEYQNLNEEEVMQMYSKNPEGKEYENEDDFEAVDEQEGPKPKGNGYTRQIDGESTGSKKGADAFDSADKGDFDGNGNENGRVSSADQNYQRSENFFKKGQAHQKQGEPSNTQNTGWTRGATRATVTKRTETGGGPRKTLGGGTRQNDYLIRGKSTIRAGGHSSPKGARREMFVGVDKERLIHDYQGTRVENNNLKKENHLLKTKVAYLENEAKQAFALMNKMEAEAAAKESSVAYSALGGLSGVKRDSKLEYNLKCEINELKKELRKKEAEIENFKKSTKFTKVNELEIEAYTQQDEIKKLMSILENKIELESLAREKAEAEATQIEKLELELEKARETIEAQRKMIEEYEAFRKSSEKTKLESERQKRQMEGSIAEMKRKVAQRDKDFQRQKEEITRLRKIMSLPPTHPAVKEMLVVNASSNQESHTNSKLPSNSKTSQLSKGEKEQKEPEKSMMAKEAGDEEGERDEDNQLTGTELRGYLAECQEKRKQPDEENTKRSSKQEGEKDIRGPVEAEKNKKEGETPAPQKKGGESSSSSASKTNKEKPSNSASKSPYAPPKKASSKKEKSKGQLSKEKDEKKKENSLGVSSISSIKKEEPKEKSHQEGRGPEIQERNSSQRKLDEKPSEKSVSQNDQSQKRLTDRQEEPAQSNLKEEGQEDRKEADEDELKGETPKKLLEKDAVCENENRKSVGEPINEQEKMEKENERPSKKSIKEEKEFVYLMMSLKGKSMNTMKNEISKNGWSFREAVNETGASSEGIERLNKYFEKSEDPETAWDELFANYPKESLKSLSEATESIDFLEEVKGVLPSLNEETYSTRSLKETFRRLGVTFSKTRILELFFSVLSLDHHDHFFPVSIQKKDLRGFIETTLSQNYSRSSPKLRETLDMAKEGFE